MTISVGLSPRTIHLVRELFFPLAFSVALIQAFSFLLAWIMHRLTRWDVMTSCLPPAPAASAKWRFLRRICMPTR